MTAIQVATWDGSTLQVSVSPIPPPGFALLTAGDYIPGQACVLSVSGADGAYAVWWSPSGSDHTAGIQLSVVSDSLDGNGDGTITVTANRGDVPYGATGYLWLVQGAETASLAKTLLPEDGKQWVWLTTVDQLDGAFRITAIPDLDVGDQLIWWDIQPSGDVVILGDGSFNCSADVESFKVEVWSPGLGYGGWATQTVSDPAGEDTGEGTAAASAVATTTAAGSKRGRGVALAVARAANTATGRKASSGTASATAVARALAGPQIAPVIIELPDMIQGRRAVIRVANL